jgi:hypothetical protein
MLNHFCRLCRSVDHWHHYNARANFQCAKHVMPLPIGHADRGDAIARLYRHAHCFNLSEIGGTMLHLNPDSIEANLDGHFC